MCDGKLDIWFHVNSDACSVTDFTMQDSVMALSLHPICLPRTFLEQNDFSEVFIPWLLDDSKQFSQQSLPSKSLWGCWPWPCHPRSDDNVSDASAKDQILAASLRSTTISIPVGLHYVPGAYSFLDKYYKEKEHYADHWICLSLLGPQGHIAAVSHPLLTLEMKVLRCARWLLESIWLSRTVPE